MEEESIPCYRSDGSEVVGLTCSEWETYLENYSNLSEKELIDIRDIQAPKFDKPSFEIRAHMLHTQKGRLEQDTSLATPLFVLFSVQVIPVPVGIKLFPVYGEITSHDGYFDDDEIEIERAFFYKRESHDAEDVGRDGGFLTLNGPSRSCRSRPAYNLLSTRKLSVKLYSIKDARLLVDDSIIFADSPTELEKVNKIELRGRGVRLIFNYVSIPMASYGRLELNVLNKSYSQRKSVQVYGKVVAKYKNTYGDYNSEEIVLFHKNPNEYETIVVGLSINLLFPTRHWLAVPAYSLLLVHLDLFEFGTNQQILKKDVEMEVEASAICKDFITSTEFVIRVFASWFVPFPPREVKAGDHSGQEECEDADDSIQGEHMDADDSIQGEPMDAEDSGQGEPTDGGGDAVQISRMLRPCTILRQFSAFEVFSVLICYKKCMPLNIHGLLQFSFDFISDFHDGAITIFEKGKEDPLSLLERRDIVHVLKGSRRRNDKDRLSVSCDLKDTLGELSIKGIQSCCQFDRILYLDRPLCSIFQGDHGFAALHYALFTSAVQANFKVLYTENGLEGVGFPVFGIFYAEYNNFDCSSWHEKNCYKIVLFERIMKKDSVRVGADGLIPLSRSSFVVPSISSLTLYVELVIGTKKFLDRKIIKTKRNVKSGDTISWSIEVDECEVKIDLEWSEVQ